jgi:hypothetical protein
MIRRKAKDLAKKLATKYGAEPWWLEVSIAKKEHEDDWFVIVSASRDYGDLPFGIIEDMKDHSASISVRLTDWESIAKGWKSTAKNVAKIRKPKLDPDTIGILIVCAIATTFMLAIIVAHILN